jgi:hypothetical protein
MASAERLVTAILLAGALLVGCSSVDESPDEEIDAAEPPSETQPVSCHTFPPTTEAPPEPMAEFGAGALFGIVHVAPDRVVSEVAQLLGDTLFALGDEASGASVTVDQSQQLVLLYAPEPPAEAVLRAVADATVDQDLGIVDGFRCS